MNYRELDRFARKRLSRHFFMRDFLYSEISACFGIPNFPDNPELAIHTGTQLCEQILEPIVDAYGPIQIRSGFRSATLNAVGAKKRLNCAANESNYAYHIWDHLDAAGDKGAVACIVVPKLIDNATGDEAWRDMATFIHENLPYNSATFFRQNFAFNIGWHEKPKREIYSWYPRRGWFAKNGVLVP